MELVSHKQISTLVNLFTEFNEAEGLFKLYSSTQSSYAELISFGPDLFKINNKATVIYLMHKLKNQFKNLGMVAAADLLAQLKSRVEGESQGHEQDLALLERLKEISFLSFGYIFDNYLD